MFGIRPTFVQPKYMQSTNDQCNGHPATPRPRSRARRVPCPRSLSFFVTVLGLLSPTVASADDARAADAKEAADTEATAGDGRVVNGHSFITPQFADTAFLNTSFRFAQGFGIASFAAVSPLTGEGTNGTLLLYGQQLLTQIGIGNRFAIDLRG